MPMKKQIAFGTGGFRGVIGDDFNKENIQYIAQALANIVNRNHQADRPIIVGYDNRFMSDFAAKWFVEVLNGNGIKCFLYTHSVPTPTVMSTTRDMCNYYGVMMTASHNPYYFNGIKVFTIGGYDADVNFTSSLEKEIAEVEEIKTMTDRVARRKDLLDKKELSKEEKKLLDEIIKEESI